MKKAASTKLAGSGFLTDAQLAAKENGEAHKEHAQPVTSTPVKVTENETPKEGEAQANQSTVETQANESAEETQTNESTEGTANHQALDDKTPLPFDVGVSNEALSGEEDGEKGDDKNDRGTKRSIAFRLSNEYISKKRKLEGVIAKETNTLEKFKAQFLVAGMEEMLRGVRMCLKDQAQSNNHLGLLGKSTENLQRAVNTVQYRVGKSNCSLEEQAERCNLKWDSQDKALAAIRHHKEDLIEVLTARVPVAHTRYVSCLLKEAFTLEFLGRTLYTAPSGKGITKETDYRMGVEIDKLDPRISEFFHQYIESNGCFDAAKKAELTPQVRRQFNAAMRTRRSVEIGRIINVALKEPPTPQANAATAMICNDMLSFEAFQNTPALDLADDNECREYAKERKPLVIAAARRKGKLGKDEEPTSNRALIEACLQERQKISTFKRISRSIALGKEEQELDFS